MKPKHILASSVFAALFAAMSTLTHAATIASNPALLLESTAGVTSDGSNRVSSWSDLSGVGHNASQLTLSAQPILVNNVFNGLPSLRFNGVSNFLPLAGQVLHSQQFSIFAVVTDTSTGASNGLREIFSNWAGANSTTSVFLGSTNHGPISTRFTDDYVGIGILSTPSSPFVLSALSNSASVALYQNESLLGSRNSPLSIRNLTTAYAIGQQGPANNSEFWAGDIGAIIVYDRELTDAERIQTTQYLESKYVGNVPEPSAFFLMVIGVIGAFGFRNLRQGEAHIKVR